MNPKNVSIDIRRCRCHAYHDVLESMGFIMAPDNPNANIVWWDGSIPLEEFNSIKQEQHVNKIPGMDYLCYKSVLFNSLNQMQRLYPTYYDFFPKTYLLPQQFQEFQKEHQKSIARSESNYLRSKSRHPTYLKIRYNKIKPSKSEEKDIKDDKEKDQNNASIETSKSTPQSDLPSIILSDEPEQPTWIVKPRSGCCGSGIRLIQNSFDLAHDSTPSIVQKYVHPFLIEGHKFDFRFYLLITNLQPLSLFIYNEGIARFCTEKYEPPTRKNLNDKFIHITNTAINVENKNIKKDEFEFTRLASDVLKSIGQIDSEKGGEVLWSKIKQISILTILALYPEIMSSVKNVCGEFLLDEVEKSNPDSESNSNKKKVTLVSTNTHSNDRVVIPPSRRAVRKPSVNQTDPIQTSPSENSEEAKIVKEPPQKVREPSNSEKRNSYDRLFVKNEMTVSKNPTHRFFHLLGIDIMIDENCEPILLELNDNPSMKITFEIEKKLKKQLLTDELSIVTLDGSQAPIEAIEKGGWIMIIPPQQQPAEQNPVIERKDKQINSLIRSIQQRSMNIFGPSTNLVKKSKKLQPRTPSHKARYKAQLNSHPLNNSSTAPQNSIGSENLSKTEIKLNALVNEPDLISKKSSQKNHGVSMSVGTPVSKASRSIIHPKVKYSAAAEKTGKFRKTGVLRYYHQ
ncbi:positive regulation of cilium movement [Tritrichomonas musculus]|uniref:Positive regulation of cilium movement n=1 Tax=Tritrichomonas musculus TaxID=1915356 RepID=A0ABR2L230_9EUKA